MMLAVLVAMTLLAGNSDCDDTVLERSSDTNDTSSASKDDTTGKEFQWR